MEKNKPGFSALAQEVILPKERLLEVKRGSTQLYIGVPKEISYEENRVPLVPDAVALLVNNGHQIIMESGAGKAANFYDHDYSEAGAQIVYSPEEIFKADIVLKIAPPSANELELLKNRQTLISILQISTQSKEFIKQLTAKKITAIAFEYLQDKTGAYPIVQAMSEIAGGTSILIAAEYMSNTFNGKGSLLGGVTGITPTEVVILGAGTVGEYAARAALGLGASVKVFDNSLYKLRRLQNDLGMPVYTSILVPNIVLKALKTADVVIGAISPKDGRVPCVVTEAMVEQMKSGSVVVDVSIDQGGCFETSSVTSHSKPVFLKHDVIHYCVPNIASRVSRTASYALSNIFTPIILNIAELGGIEEMLWEDIGVRKGIYVFRGNVTNRYVAELSNTAYKDLDLLMATRI